MLYCECKPTEYGGHCKHGPVFVGIFSDEWIRGIGPVAPFKNVLSIWIVSASLLCSLAFTFFNSGRVKFEFARKMKKEQNF
jgi:hypothetical protein